MAAIEPFLPLIGYAEFTAYDHQRAEHQQLADHQNPAAAILRGTIFWRSRCHWCTCRSNFSLSVWLETRPSDLCGGWQSAEIQQVAVSPQHQRQGLGSQLLRTAENWLAGQNVYCLYLATYPADFDVIAFYGKSGYLPSGCLPDVYGPGLEGKLFLRKVLIA
jgi:GNAT superfamily N-acetyltransferase